MYSLIYKPDGHSIALKATVYAFIYEWCPATISTSVLTKQINFEIAFARMHQQFYEWEIAAAIGSLIDDGFLPYQYDQGEFWFWSDGCYSILDRHKSGTL